MNELIVSLSHAEQLVEQFDFEGIKRFDSLCL